MQAWKDPVTDCNVQAQVVFEVCIQPGSYDIGHSTISGYKASRDFPTLSIEWYTKGEVKGAQHIRALLLRLDPPGSR